LICSNAQFGEILALPPHLVQLGIPLQEILEFMSAVSPASFGDPDGLLQRRLDAYTTEGEPYLERLPDGHMVIEVCSNRMPVSLCNVRLAALPKLSWIPVRHTTSRAAGVKRCPTVRKTSSHGQCPLPQLEQ